MRRLYCQTLPVPAMGQAGMGRLAQENGARPRTDRFVPVGAIRRVRTPAYPWILYFTPAALQRREP
jgi:hypothetical protein